MHLKSIIFLLNCCLLICQSSCAQKNDGWKNLLIKPSATYEIADENMVIARDFFNEPNDTVRASLKVDNDELIRIRFSKVEFRSDTMKIMLYENSEAFSNRFLITIVKDKYFISYQFLVDVSEDDSGVIIPYESVIELNTIDFKKRPEIRGSVDFKGKRSNSKNEDLVIVKGNFKAIL
jgi:hypothetical protein